MMIFRHEIFLTCLSLCFSFLWLISGNSLSEDIGQASTLTAFKLGLGNKKKKSASDKIIILHKVMRKCQLNNSLSGRKET